MLQYMKKLAFLLLVLTGCNNLTAPEIQKIQTEEINRVSISQEALKDSVIIPDRFCIDVDGEYVCNF